MIPALIVLIFATLFAIPARGGRVTLASIPGVYRLLSVRNSNLKTLPFCTTVLTVPSGTVSASDLILNGNTGVCTGSWTFTLDTDTKYLSNTTGSLSNSAISELLQCSSNKVTAFHFYPTVNPTIVLDVPVSIQGGLKYIMFAQRQTGVCLYQESKTVPAQNPTSPKVTPLDPGGVRVPGVPSRQRHYLKWLIPLIAFLVVAPFVICVIGLCRARIKRKNGDVAQSVTPSLSTSKPNQATTTHGTTQSTASTHYSHTAYSPQHSPAPHSPPGSPPYYPDSPPPMPPPPPPPMSPPLAFAPQPGV